jgi:transposase
MATKTKTETASGAAGPDRGGRMSRQRKRDAVLRLLRGKDLETVLRALGVTAGTLSGWRDAFLAASEASFSTRPAGGEELESERLKARLVVAAPRRPALLAERRASAALGVRDQHIHLPQLGHGLLRPVLLARHLGPPPVQTHTSGRTTSEGEDQSIADQCESRSSRHERLSSERARADAQGGRRPDQRSSAAVAPVALAGGGTPSSPLTKCRRLMGGTTYCDI